MQGADTTPGKDREPNHSGHTRLSGDPGTTSRLSSDPGTIPFQQLGEALAELLDRGSESDCRQAWEALREENHVDAPDSGTDVCPVTPASIVEAILFVGDPQDEPISAESIIGVLRGVDGAELDTIVARLNDRYQQDGAPYRIVAQGTGYRLQLCPEFHRLRDGMATTVRRTRLSQPALDALAVVAYHQPVTRTQVEEWLGRRVGAILTSLVRRQLLAIERPAERPREVLYRTTDRFLALFGLQSLDDLPRGGDGPCDLPQPDPL